MSDWDSDLLMDPTHTFKICFMWICNNSSTYHRKSIEPTCVPSLALVQVPLSLTLAVENREMKEWEEVEGLDDIVTVCEDAYLSYISSEEL